MENEQRTWEDFVSDMVANGRNLRQIKTVARLTRWAPYIAEIKERAKKLRNIMRFPKNIDKK